MANDRLSQLPVEVLVDPDSGKARTSQEPVEVLVSPDSSKARTSQEPVEVLLAPNTAKARTSQVPVEVLVQNLPPIRVTQAPVEVVVTDDAPAIRVTQSPVEVVVADDAPAIRVTQAAIEVILSRDVTESPPPAEASVAAVLPTAIFSYVIAVATATLDAVAPTFSYTFSVATAEITATTSAALDLQVISSTATASVEAVAPALSITLVTASAEATVQGNDVVLQGALNLLVDAAEVLVEMPDVGYSETPIQVVVVGGMGAEPMPVDLFGLLTLKVSPAHWHVSLSAPSLKYYRTPEERRAKRFLRIFKPAEPPQFAMQATQNVTFKVTPHEHLIIRVREQQDFFNFAVESAPVYFEERTSALWGDLRRRSYLDEAKDLLSLHPGRSRISPSNRLRVKPPRGT